MSSRIEVEIVYALPGEQSIVPFQVEVGTTLVAALRLSGILSRHAEIDLATTKFGIYGTPAGLETVLRDRDRIEIYRPLIADPKEVRRARAEKGKAKNSART